jgi:hypothetical protein
VAKKPPRRWTWSPARPPKVAVPAALKAEVEAKAKALIETVLKPEHVKPPPKDPKWNYLTDIGCKWRGSYFYFISTYASPGPNALSPSFESPFTRLGYAGAGKFNVAYMRHTGKWWEVRTGLSADEALAAVRDDPWFQP